MNNIAFGSHAARGANLLLTFGKSFANSPHSDQLGWSDSMNFFVTRTKRHNYLNLSNNFERTGSDREPKGTASGYTFIEYHLSRRGELILSELRGDYLSNAVKERKLRGKIMDEGMGSTTLLTDSSDHIVAFIEASNAHDVFGLSQKLSRIGGP